MKNFRSNVHVLNHFSATTTGGGGLALFFLLLVLVLHPFFLLPFLNDYTRFKSVSFAQQLSVCCTVCACHCERMLWKLGSIVPFPASYITSSASKMRPTLIIVKEDISVLSRCSIASLMACSTNITFTWP